MMEEANAGGSAWLGTRHPPKPSRGKQKDEVAYLWRAAFVWSAEKRRCPSPPPWLPRAGVPLGRWGTGLGRRGARLRLLQPRSFTGRLEGPRPLRSGQPTPRCCASTSSCCPPRGRSRCPPSPPGAGRGGPPGPAAHHRSGSGSELSTRRPPVPLPAGRSQLPARCPCKLPAPAGTRGASAGHE